MLEHVAWSKPDSKTLEHLVWSVYDGLLSPGPTPKLMGPKSYNQVTRCLATKVFRGLQVCCLARTSAQFDKPTPVRVRSVVFATPPSEMVRKTEATGRCVSPSILRECWPLKHDIVPRQLTNEVRAHITYCLDQVAMQSPSTIAWDIFMWPESNKSYWKEDCLPYSPGSMVDLSSRMLGIWLVLHNEAGKYQGVTRVLKYEGHMLVYDPQTNGVGWVAMRGIPSFLIEIEL